MVMNLQVPLIAGTLLNSWGTDSFSGMTVHHEVNLMVGAFPVIRHRRFPADRLKI
jgi:hypothetical protein